MGSFGAKKGHFVPKQALSGLLAAKTRPDTMHSSPGVLGPYLAPPGPPRTFRTPKRGILGQKLALFWSLGAKKRPKTRPKCVVKMFPTQSE